MLDNVLFGIRCSPNDVNGETPYFRMFNREMNTKLSKLQTSPDIQISARKRDVIGEYSKKKSIVRDYEIGQKVLVRKQKMHRMRISE